jgi:hypothetical protein
MKVSSLFFHFIDAYWFVVPLVIIVGIFKSPWGKGFLGELIVKLSMRLLLDKNRYFQFHNVTLSCENGTTQIDHIVVSEWGVFVIETKNLKGWIYGSERQKFWTQKLFKQSNTFQNPLHQNFKHVKALQEELSIDDDKIFSVIVFVGDSRFKTKMPENVFHGIRFIGYIKSKKDRVLNRQRVMEIKTELESIRMTPSFKTRQQHIRHVKSIKNRKAATPIPSCPRCGSAMVLRKAGKGSRVGSAFWGCSKYPRCRGAVNIN